MQMELSAEQSALKIKELESRLEEYEQLVEAIKSGEVDAFALNKNNQSEIFTLQSGDYAYRILVENFMEGALNLSEDALVVYTNNYFLDLLKLPYESVIGNSFFQFIHSESKETFNELFKKGLAGRSKGEINLSVNDKTIPVYVSLTSLYPTLPTVGMIVTDLTEKKEQEKMLMEHKKLEISKKLLEESEQRYHQLIYSSPSAIGILYGEDLVITVANKPIIEIWGKGKEIIGKKYFEVLPELAEQGYKEVFAQVYRTGIPFNAIETPVHILQNGVATLKYYNFILYPQRNINGEVVGIGIIATDVSTQALLNNKVKESEAQFSAMADNIANLAWMARADGWIYWYNKKWYEYTGTSLEQMEGWGWQIVHDPEHLPLVMKNWQTAIASGQVFEMTFPLKGADGKFRQFLTRVLPVKDEQGKVQHWFGTNTDITEQKTFAEQLEIKVEERTNELEEKNLELEKMNKELQSFAYISSHDLQEPLRKIQTFSTRILEKEENNLSEHGKDNFKRMQDAAKRMQTLINDLLAYSRTNTTERKFETTDLNKIIDEVKNDLQEELKEKHATIEATELCEVNVIPFQFRQLMHNLIGNALKFSNPKTLPQIKIKSKVEVGVKFNNQKLSPQKKYCHISVRDNGIGFEQQYSEKIFEVFQRLHGKTEYDGTGIGLSIVKKIVENHEGFITATSELNKGASFDIYIPAT